ncbi:MAG TPA: DMT family transporter, partial [Thermoleophilia bacterium]|nr:DMT family transporter [Thermoleophilia bacterium]
MTETSGFDVAATSRRRTRGYVEIVTASLILGTSGALLQVSTMPASLLLVLRMALAGLALAPIFLLTRGVTEVRRSGRFWRLVLIGAVVAFELLFYFASIRLSNVATGIALEYTAPVWVAFVAPWVLHTRRERADMAAVGVAAIGMALIVLPSLSASGAHLGAGVACGVVAGALYAAALLLTKSVGPGIRGITFTLFHCICTTVLLAPLAIWQATSSHYRLTLQDAVIVLLMGLVYTALCFSLFTDGLRFVRVEHAG